VGKKRRQRVSKPQHKTAAHATLVGDSVQQCTVCGVAVWIDMQQPITAMYM
jgi:hypothetical protein